MTTEAWILLFTVLIASFVWMCFVWIEWSVQPPPQPLIHCYVVTIERPDKSQYPYVCKAFDKESAIDLAQGFVDRHESGYVVIGADRLY